MSVEQELHDLPIDELARRTGMTVRNIRAHQSRGLLPPPEVRGRTGYYGTEHLARIELIKELQNDGFHLDAVRRMLEGADGSSTEVLRFTRAVRAAFEEEEEPQIVELSELAERWGPGANPDLLRRAISLGLLRDMGDGRFAEISPRLSRMADELSALGVPLGHALELAARIRRHADAVAKMYAELFVDVVWEPFKEDGAPPERWVEVLDSLERLRPMAAESLLSLFQLAMNERVEKTLGRELERIGKRHEGQSSARLRLPKRRTAS